MDNKRHTFKMCTGCGRLDNEPLGLNKNGEPYLACCPDNHYIPTTSLDWFESQDWKLRIQLEKKEISLGEFAVTHVDLFKKAKAMHKQETIDFAAEWSVCQLRSDKIWHLDDLYNEKFTDTI